jgi:hypothetical protein
LHQSPPLIRIQKIQIVIKFPHLSALVRTQLPLLDIKVPSLVRTQLSMYSIL